MKETGILFSGEMVRATLDGRKTQTRRVVKPQPEPHPDGKHRWCRSGMWWAHAGAGMMVNMEDMSGAGPYGTKGDRLWVRETWGVGCRPDPHEGWYDGIEYRADDFGLDEHDIIPCFPVEPPEGIELDGYHAGWHSSIHMPRWASRITLEVTGVRVERVQEISKEDALAEGVSFTKYPETSQFQFKNLWQSINAKRGYGWDVNPWVWVVEFKKEEGS